MWETPSIWDGWDDIIHLFYVKLGGRQLKTGFILQCILLLRGQIVINLLQMLNVPTGYGDINV